MGVLEYFGIRSRKKQLLDFYEKGAIIVDVRSAQEFATDHLDNAINVPLGSIKSKVNKLKKMKKPLILCCASGVRSASATRFLKSEGLECMNGGGWKTMNNEG